MSWSVISQAHLTLLLKLDGSLYGWGNNIYHQLDSGDATIRSSPVRLPGSFSQVSASMTTCVGLTWESEVLVWGTTDPSSLSTERLPLSDVIEISSGHHHHAMLQRGGKLWLYFDDRSSDNKLQEVKDHKFDRVACSLNTTMGFKGSEVYVWGQDQTCLIFSGNEIFYPQPVQVKTTRIDPSRSILGAYHGFQINPDGTTWSWGDNKKGQLGLGNFSGWVSPGPISRIKFQMVSPGHDHSLGIDLNGTCWAWGSNFCGQLGVRTSERSVNSPIIVTSNVKFKSVKAGFYTSFALTSDGLVYTWGLNDQGQLGLGHCSPVVLPTIIPQFTVGFVKLKSSRGF